MDAPAERELRQLGAYFEETEAAVRRLLRRAPAGDRRALLESALATLAAARVEAYSAGPMIHRAYAIAASALLELAGDAGVEPSIARVRDLASSLSAQLARAVREAERASRDHFAHATEENVDELPITGRIGADGRRYPLGAHASMLTQTIGRHATARATPDVLGSDGRVEIEGGECEVCAPFQGEASAALTPPFHPGCNCEASPVDVDREELYAAQEAQLDG